MSAPAILTRAFTPIYLAATVEEQTPLSLQESSVDKARDALERAKQVVGASRARGWPLQLGRTCCTAQEGQPCRARPAQQTASSATLLGHRALSRALQLRTPGHAAALLFQVLSLGVSPHYLH